MLIDSLDETTRSIGQAGPKPFSVLCTPGFAARWLVPRLDRLAFGDRVRISVSSGAPSTDFVSNGADLAIQWAGEPIQDVVTEPLMETARYPVISPALAKKVRLSVLEDLRRATLLHDETMDGWEEWFDAAEVDPPDFPCGPIFSNCELVAIAAERGQGVALAHEAVVREAVQAGSLLPLFDTVPIPVVTYSVAYLKSKEKDPMLREFLDWIHGEAHAEGVAALGGQCHNG